jgi:Spy/CpxP family protein refolding chaperone
MKTLLVLAAALTLAGAVAAPANAHPWQHHWHHHCHWHHGHRACW